MVEKSHDSKSRDSKSHESKSHDGKSSDSKSYGVGTDVERHTQGTFGVGDPGTARDLDRERDLERDIVTGEPEPDPVTTRVELPVATPAQQAAGPLRPEPAKQVARVAGSEPVPDAVLRGTAAPIKVRATQDGYYGEARRRTGDVFYLTDMASFSKKWMERVPEGTAESRTTGQEVINQRHDALLGGRVKGAKATGDARVLD